VASLTITTRQTSSGPRYVVRFRLGGRAYPIQHGGSFKTMREARGRRDFVAGELAAGRNPAEALLHAVEQPKHTLSTWADAYIASRIDTADTTLRALRIHLDKFVPAFGDRDPSTLTATEIGAWVAEQAPKLAPATLRRYVATFAALLDHIGLVPNPAKDKRVRLPRIVVEPVSPPSGSQVTAIISAVPKRWRLPLRVLEQTGLRVGELCELCWRDVDATGSRFRVRRGKTAAATRWVVLPEAIMEQVVEQKPPEDRLPDLRVFPGLQDGGLRQAMTRACTALGVAVFSPHDLRHRYASVKIREGVPITDLAAQLGHARKSMTLDTYSHVLLETEA
jgi:integrase